MVFSLALFAVYLNASSYDGIADWIKGLSQEKLQEVRCWKNPRTNRFQVPSEPTIRRLLQSVNAPLLEEVLAQLWDRYHPIISNNLAVDGKTLRASSSPHTKTNTLLCAVKPNTVFYGQEVVPADANEISVLKILLRYKDLVGMCITIDALHTKQDTARFLVQEKGADYYMTLKRNQKHSLRNAQMLLSKKEFLPDFAKTEKAYGRIETRSIQIRAISPSEVHFAHARTLILIKRECHYCNFEKKDTVEWA